MGSSGARCRVFELEALRVECATDDSRATLFMEAVSRSTLTVNHLFLVSSLPPSFFHPSRRVAGDKGAGKVGLSRAKEDG